jgi:hypothetical protein
MSSATKNLTLAAWQSDDETWTWIMKYYFAFQTPGNATGTNLKTI